MPCRIQCIEMLSLLHVITNTFTAVSKGSNAVWNAMASAVMDLSKRYRFVSLHQILSSHFGDCCYTCVSFAREWVVFYQLTSVVVLVA